MYSRSISISEKARRSSQRTSRSIGCAVALATIAAACGGSSDEASDTASPADQSAEDVVDSSSEPDAAAADAAAGDDAAADDSAPADDTASDSGTEAEADASAASAGSGSLPADLCADGAPLSGAISLDDFVEFGILSSTDATVDGAGDLSAVAYNDFGSLCNIEGANGDFVTIGMSAGASTYQLTLEQSGATPTQAGEWQYLVVSGLTQVAMLHTDAAGNENSLFVTWLPSDDARRATESAAVLTPFVEAIVASSTVDVPMIDAPGTPPWFLCDDTNPGVVGLDPAAIGAVLGLPDGTPLEITDDVRASFGNTLCTTRSAERDFPFGRIDVQTDDAQLADTLDTYLAGWPEATAETLAGRDVAVRLDTSFGQAFVFTVIDGYPTTVQLSVTNFDGDLGESVRALAALFYGGIG